MENVHSFSVLLIVVPVDVDESVSDTVLYWVEEVTADEVA